ncbi:MAG: hypothetical protein IT377_18690 [Polyangiaceae bacterium]|nr:hypothetical protein [Polyangiaceae bacterium]
MTPQLTTLFAGACLASLVTTPCLAEPTTRAERAAAHFDTGLTLYQQGRMRDAASEFLAAFELAPHGDAMFNAGLAFDGAGDSAGAATAFAWALELGMRGEAAPEAKVRLARLAPRLGTVRVTAAEGATLEVSPFRRKASIATFHALPGQVLVSVTYSDGAVAARQAQVRVGAETLIDFQTPAAPVAAPAPAPVPDAPAPDASAPFPWPALGWASIGVGAAAGVGALVLRGATLGAKDDYDASGHTDADARQRALDLNRWTNVALVGAIATGAFGIGVLVLHREPKREVSLGLAPGRVQVIGRF